MKQTFRVVAILGIAASTALWGRVSLGEALRAREAQRSYEDEVQWSTPQISQALALNYKTFLADLLWIDLQLYMSNFREAGAGATPPAHMIQRGEAVHTIDPNFSPIYEWLNAAYINSRLPIGARDLNLITDFYLKGAPYVEEPGDLYYRAGMNFIGYSHEHSREEKIAGLKRGIALLQKASKYPASNAKIPGVVSYLFARLERLESSDGAQQMENRQVLIEYQRAAYALAPDQQARGYIEAKLKELGVTAQELKALQNRHAAQVDLLKQGYRGYLPGTLWLTLYGEAPQFFTPPQRVLAP